MVFFLAWARRRDAGNAVGEAPAAGVAAPRVGLYRATSGTDVKEVGAALLNAGETRMARTDKIYFNEQLSVEA